MSRRGFLTGGCWIVDRNVLVETWPAENGFARARGEVMSGGGSTYNFAANIKSLDREMPVAVTALGADDQSGKLLQDLAAEKGIDTSALVIAAGEETDEALCFASEDTGRRTHIGKFGTALRLTPDHLTFESDAKLFHAGLPGIHPIMDAPWHDEPNGWVAALKRARAAGLKTNMELVSTTPDEIARLIRPCLAHLDLLIVNDHEIGGIAGIETVPNDETNREACLEAARWVMANGAMELLAVHFPLGSIVLTRSGEVVEKGSVTVPAEENSGANGAGDAFAAGFAYGWHEGWSLDEMLALGHAAAATSLRDITTTRAVEDWRTCLELANRWGWRHHPGERTAAR